MKWVIRVVVVVFAYILGTTISALTIDLSGAIVTLGQRGQFNALGGMICAIAAYFLVRSLQRKRQKTISVERTEIAPE